MKQLAVAIAILGAFAYAITNPQSAHAAERKHHAHHAQAHQAKPRNVAYVTVIDQTNGAWPADMAAVEAAWDSAPNVRVRRAAACIVRTYCVTVQAVAAGATPWMGQTMPGYTSAIIQMNTDLLAKFPDIASDVYCHELGHALGIGHPDVSLSRPGVTGCIASTDASLTTPVPSAADLAEAAAIFNHTTLQGAPQQWGALWALVIDGHKLGRKGVQDALRVVQ